MKKLFAALAVLALVTGAVALTGPANASVTSQYGAFPNQGANS